MLPRNNPRRAGITVNQLHGELRYQAYIPKDLPPDPPLYVDMEMMSLLSEADRALGRLDGVTETLPNPDLFVAMYVRKEAVLSSQIEGTQSSLVDVLEYESEQAMRGLPADVGEVVNYVHAMNYGLERLKDLPVSLRLIREIHATLLEGVRGSECNPGEFRSSQNWIGFSGYTLSQATFVPPPPSDVITTLGALERFIHDESPMPILIKIGLVHAQFETIHPFLDGNGRIGRLLITLLLCENEVMHRPLLYLSYYLKQNRQQYYDRLLAIRNHGDWEGWLSFFLQGILEVSRQATETGRRVIALQEKHRRFIQTQISGTHNSLILLDVLYKNPIVTVKLAREILKISNVAANRLIAQFQNAGILAQINANARNRVFAYREYLNLFDDNVS